MNFFADRVKDATSSGGTGPIILSGVAPTGYQTFATAFGAQSRMVAYCIAEQAAAKWEVGYGLFNGTTGLTRATVLSSSDAGAPVNFPSGTTKDVFCMLPAAAAMSSVALASGQSAASANTALLQAALDAGGEVNISNPGLYYINEVLTIRSNTHVYIGAGVELKVADGANCGAFTNAAARTAGITVTPAETTWFAFPSGNYGVRIAKTGIGNTFPLSSVISVVLTGHLTWPDTHGHTQGFRGLWDVVTSTPDMIEFQIKKLTPGNGAGGFPISGLVYRADENIKITGPGTINGNGANQTLYGVGNPRGNVIWTRHASNVEIEGLRFLRGITWTIGSNYVRYYSVKKISGDTRGGDTNDLIHLSGQHQSVEIDSIHAAVGDNTVGLTIDITDDPSNSWTNAGNTVGNPNFNNAWNYDDRSGTYRYKFPYQDPGDMFDISVSRVYSVNTAGFAICGIYGPGSYKYYGLTFDDIAGETSTAVQLSNYPQTGMNNVRGDKLRVTNLHATCTGQQLRFTGVQNWDTVVYEDAVLTNTLNEAVTFDNSIGSPAAAQNYGQVTLKNFYSSGTSARTGPLVSVVGGSLGVNITALSVSDMEKQRFAESIPLFLHAGFGLINRLSMTNVSASAAVGGAGNGLLSVTGAGACDEAVLRNCSLTSQGSLGSMVALRATAAYKTVSLNACTVAGASSLIDVASATATINVFMSDVTLGTGCARAALFAGSTNLFVNGYSELTAPSTNPFQCLTAAKAYTFRFENVGRDTDLITKTAGNLRMHGMGARTDSASANAPVAGDVIFNTNAASAPGIGLAIYDGAAWRRINIVTQTVAFSATPALNCSLGNNVVLSTTLSAGVTWGAPTRIPAAGETVTITMTQSGTGGFAVAWNAAYIFPTAWTNTGNTPGKKSSITFISDGSALVAAGANRWY